MPFRTGIPDGTYEPVGNDGGANARPVSPPSSSDTAEPTAQFVRCPLQPINPASPDTLRDFYILRRGMPIRRMLPPKPLGQ